MVRLSCSTTIELVLLAPISNRIWGTTITVFPRCELALLSTYCVYIELGFYVYILRLYSLVDRCTDYSTSEDLGGEDCLIGLYHLLTILCSTIASFDVGLSHQHGSGNFRELLKNAWEKSGDWSR